MPSAALPQEVTVGPHTPSSSQIQWTCYKNEKWNGKPRLECVNDWHPPSKTPVYFPEHAGVMGNDPADRLAGKATLTIVACLWQLWVASQKIWSVEEFETLPAGTKPRTPHHRTLGGEAWKEEVIDNLPWKDERGPSSVRRTMEPFQRRHWGNFWETGGGAYMGFSERIDTILNWTLSVSLSISVRARARVCVCMCVFNFLWFRTHKRLKKTKHIDGEKER